MRILVTGATGLLGRYLVREVALRGHELVAWSVRGAARSRVLDLTDLEAIAPALEDDAPDAVIHAAAVANLADCLAEPERARRINVEASARLSEACRRRGTRLVFVSTDLVFDGTEAPYAEEASPRPLSVYGRTKAEAEGYVLREGGLVVRSSLLFGAGLDGRRGFFDRQVEDLRSGRRIVGFEDEHRTPVAFETAARALVALCAHDAAGVLHLGGPERMSRLDMARRLAVILGAAPDLVTAASRADAGGEPRPADTSLGSARLRALLPSVDFRGFEASCQAMGLGMH